MSKITNGGHRMLYSCTHTATVGVKGLMAAFGEAVVHQLVFTSPYCEHMYEHIVPLLRDRRWLLMSEQIQFKLYVFVFHCLNGWT